MKNYLLLVLFFFLSGVAIAQNSDSTSAIDNKLYVGLSLNTTSYLLNFNKTYNTSLQQPIFFTPLPYLHLGYELNKRVKMQVGIGYGKNGRHTLATQTIGSGKIKEYHDESYTQGVAIPVTVQYVLLDADKRLPFYTTISIIPMYGSIGFKTTVIENDVTTTPSLTEAKGLNVFGTAGFGFQYKMSKKFNGYAEILSLKGNLAGGGQNPFQNNRIKYLRFYWAFGLGLNYRL